MNHQNPRCLVRGSRERVTVRGVVYIKPVWVVGANRRWISIGPTHQPGVGVVGKYGVGPDFGVVANLGSHSALPVKGARSAITPMNPIAGSFDSEVHRRRGAIAAS